MSNEYDGQGGSYVVDGAGNHTLVERTSDATQAPPESPTAAAPAPQNEPAPAGFFSRVADADESATATATTTEQ